MLGRSLLNVIIPATILLGVAPAFAESRLALVIGQSAYKSVPALPNPGNDAKANAYTPASLLGAGELAFSPSRFPFMFRWQLSDEKGTVFIRFSDWLARPAEAP